MHYIVWSSLLFFSTLTLFINHRWWSILLQQLMFKRLSKYMLSYNIRVIKDVYLHSQYSSTTQHRYEKVSDSLNQSQLFIDNILSFKNTSFWNKNLRAQNVVASLETLLNILTTHYWVTFVELLTYLVNSLSYTKKLLIDRHVLKFSIIQLGIL